MKKLFLGVVILLAGSAAQAADKVDFATQIRPIFAETCYKCHGGTKHKGDFKLDSVASIQKGGKDGKDIIPGDPDKSGVYHRITLKPDDDDIMPPSDKAKPLTKAQTDLIKQWIAEGANFGDWKQDVVKETADAGTTTPAADAAGPAAEVLPQVAAASPAVLEQLRASGAQALPLCQGSNLLSIEYTSSAATTTDQQISLLAQVAPQVYDLNLAGTKVTDSALSALDGMTNLHRLHLEKTAVTDAGLSHLKNLVSLEYLNLYHTDVTNAGLDQLQPLKKLKNLYLWQSKVTEDGADGLKKAIPTVSVDLGWKEPPATQPAKPDAAKETAAG
jgi:hypothetical protein